MINSQMKFFTATR